jgi:hypothetical protein
VIRPISHHVILTRRRQTPIDHHSFTSLSFSPTIKIEHYILGSIDQFDSDHLDPFRSGCEAAGGIQCGCRELKRYEGSFGETRECQGSVTKTEFAISEGIQFFFKSRRDLESQRKRHGFEVPFDPAQSQIDKPRTQG